MVSFFFSIHCTVITVTPLPYTLHFDPGHTVMPVTPQIVA